jgi:small-conductance mechanosensitive channel
MDSVNIVENFPSYINQVKDSTYKFIPKLVTSIIILIIFITLANVFKQYFSFRHIRTQVLVEQEDIQINGEVKTNIAYQQLEFIIYYLIHVFGIFVALVNLGVQTNTILAILGIFVVGIGLSLQTTINNIWAGLYISINKLFRIGDLIEVANIKGYVQSFSLFNTVVIHVDKKVPIVIPNLQIQNGVLTNYSVNKIYS